MKYKLLGILLFTLGIGPSPAQHQGHSDAKPYSGQQSRSIKSLSEEDIAELRRGGGWGLAKAAELNGIPGPAHLLALAEQIPLRPEQVKAIEGVHRRMRNAAIIEGTRLIELERSLDELFQSGAPTPETLEALLRDIEASRRQLRYIHLSAHLQTPQLLSKAQIARYNALRGYGHDPCTNIPEGHDAPMWRKHNGCN